MSSQEKVQAHPLAPIKVPAHLPPKSPHFASSPHFGCLIESHKGVPYSSNYVVEYVNYQNASDEFDPEPAWLNELLDSPKASQTWPPHRRGSGSDTITFLEAPSNLKKGDGIAEVDGFSSSKSSVRFRGSLDFDRLEEEHPFYDLETSEGYLGMDKSKPNQPHQADAAGVQICTIRSWNSELGVVSNFDGSISATNNDLEDVLHIDVPVLQGMCLSGGLEIERENLGNLHNGRFISGDHVTPNLDANAEQDLNCISRLSSRQSAQRSRARKLQYIAELERRVHYLETQVSTLSSQVAYLDHQRSLLMADNDMLKERITAVLNDKIFKSANIQFLKKEKQRLKLLFYQQRNQLASFLQRHSSVPSFHPNWMQGDEITTSVMDAFAKLAIASNMAPTTQKVGIIRNCTDKETSNMKNDRPFGHRQVGKSLEAAVL